MMKIFHIRGKFLMGSTFQKFEKDIKAIKEENAIEKIYLDLGSKHGTKRKHIIIEEVRVD
ncbi:MAG: 50S ribosomal protein L18Ae [Candidatus Methanofastidiosia archaeon]